MDPGDAHPVIEFIEKNKLSLDSILITHYHNDHIGGVKSLKERFACTVYSSAKDNHDFADKHLVEGDSVQLFDNDINFTIIAVPGHTMGHIAYYCEKSAVLFCGDTLFSAGCGRMFEGTPEVFYQSLQKLAELPLNTKVYCTHEYTLSNLAFAQYIEPDNTDINNAIKKCHEDIAKGQTTLPSTISQELSINPFLRCSTSSVQMKAKQINPQKNANPVEIFATIRKLKDNFKA